MVNLKSKKVDLNSFTFRQRIMPSAVLLTLLRASASYDWRKHFLWVVVSAFYVQRTSEVCSYGAKQTTPKCQVMASKCQVHYDELDKRECCL